MKKRILLVLPEAFNCAGGIQMFCRALCLAAGRWAQNNDATVSTIVLNDDVVLDERYINADFTSYAGARKSKARLIKQFFRHILATRYDLIVFGHVSLSPFLLLAKLFNPGVKSVVMAYGIEVWQPLKKIQRKSLMHADMVLAISDYTRDELIKHSAIPAEKIKILPCTLDPHWKNAEPVPKHECNPPVILTVTRMNKEDRYKCIDNVIRSVPAIVQEVGPVEYKVIGQGDDVPRLQALATGLGVARYVDFMGGVSDTELRSQYQDCSLFIMPSKKEGFGIVFLEAMAYGKPVVGGAHGGTPSVVKNGVTGFLTDSSDVKGIAHAVIQLLSDGEMREKFGLAGHQRLLNEFTFERFESNLKKVFQSLL